jgi:protein-S-isoprenylcysteine O-methyltransferase Ste14
VPVWFNLRFESDPNLDFWWQNGSMAEPAAVQSLATGNVGASGAGVRSAISSALTVVGVPVLVYFLYFSVGFNDGQVLPLPAADFGAFVASIVPTVEAAVVYGGWLLLQVLLYVVLPGPVVEGLPLVDGSRLKYRINGLLAMAISIGLVLAGHAIGLYSLSWIREHFGALLSVATIFTLVLAAVMYAWGRRFPDGPPREKRDVITDYVYGTALNPRYPPVTGFDFKFFFESRPGLIGWVVVDLGFATAQLEQLGHLTTPMILVVALQAFYVGAYFWSEQGVLTMIDITSERFGWMLVYGDAAFVPLAYSLQAFYLIDHVPDIPIWFAVGVALLFAVGFYIFRGANSQKNRFRRDPEGTRIWGKPARYITTRRGTPLLVSGFWGWARHMNYLGDWLMALSFSLPTLFGSIVTYFYPIFLGTLFLTRQRRDEHWCEVKYGDDWDRYRQIVRWRIIPGIY